MNTEEETTYVVARRIDQTYHPTFHSAMARAEFLIENGVTDIAIYECKKKIHKVWEYEKDGGGTR